MRWGTFIAAAASIAAGALAPTAQAAEVTVGAPMTDPVVGEQGCAVTGCTVTASTVVVPTDGTISSWRAIGDAADVRLKLLRPNADGTLASVATSAPATIDEGGTAHPASIAARQGDRIGLDLLGSGSGPSATPVLLTGTGVYAPSVAYARVPGAAFEYLQGGLADGTSAPVAGTVASDAELLLQATLTTPDPAAGAAPVAKRPAAKKPKAKPKKKKHKHRRHRHKRRRH